MLSRTWSEILSLDTAAFLAFIYTWTYARFIFQSSSSDPPYPSSGQLTLASLIPLSWILITSLCYVASLPSASPLFRSRLHHGVNAHALFQLPILLLRPAFSLLLRPQDTPSLPLPLIDQATHSALSITVLILTLIYTTSALSIRQPILPSSSSSPSSFSSSSSELPLSAEEGQSFIQRITFSWINPLMQQGYKASLELKDMWEVPRIDQARYVIDLFARERKPSLAWSMIYYNRWDILKQFTVSITWSLSMFIAPYSLRHLLNYIRDPRDQDLPIAWASAVGLLLGPALTSASFQQGLHIGRRMGNRYRAALSGEVYEKILRQRHIDPSLEEEGLEDESKKRAADVTNLISVDVNKIALFASYNHLLYASPAQMIMALFLLHDVLGWPSALFGFLGFLILQPLTMWVSESYGRVQDQVMKVTDRRLALLGEILQGIRIVKFFAWEPRFAQRIQKIREGELAKLWSRLLANMGFSVLGFGGPILIMLLTFGAYTRLFHHALDASTAFTSLALLNTLRGAIEAFPDMIIYAIEASVSVKRIDKFLAEPDIERGEETDGESDLIGFSGPAKCVWGNEKKEDKMMGEEEEDEGFVLSNLDVNFPKKSLSVIAGPTGSGKTALLMALLGELRCVEGRVRLPRGPHGKGVAYVPQQPWLQNATIRDNILFGEPYDLERYAETVKCCALQEDFRQLGAGDQTEVGEKGIALSGGQKQRISLARAVYSRASIVLMDDVLSAVDAHTARHLYEQCLLGPLMRPRTLILVTHYVDLCTRDASLLLTLSHGQVVKVNRLALAKQRESTRGIGASSLSRPEFTRSSSAIPTLYSTTSKNQRETETGYRKRVDRRSRGSTGVSKAYRTYASLAGSPLYWMGVILLFLLTQGLVFAQGFWLKSWTRYEEGDEASEGSLKYPLIYLLLGALAVGMAALRSHSLYRGAIRVSQGLHDQMIHRVLGAPMSFFERTPIGRILNRFTADMETVDQAVPPNGSFFLIACIDTAGVVVVISLIMPGFLLVAAILCVLYAWVGSRYLGASRELKRLETSSKSPLLSLLEETVEGSVVVRAFGQEDRFQEEMHRRVDASNRPHYLLWSSNRWLAWRVDALGSLVSLLTSLYAVSRAKTMDAAMAGLALSYALSFTSQILWVVRMYGVNEMNMYSMERIQGYLDLEQEENVDAGDEDVIGDAKWPSKGHIQFDRLTLGYGKKEDEGVILRDFSLDISPGQRVGIVGRTGAGKSTLITALFRFVQPRSGRVLVDGVDLMSIPLQRSRSSLTMIPQDSCLFQGTLRFNLDPFGQRTDEEVMRVMEQVGLARSSSSDEHGSSGLTLDHVIGGGGGLSQGERQLVAMARALLSPGNRILLMDEATASVDFGTDARVQELIRTSFPKVTILCVAHRLRTILDYDRILVMDSGKVVEDGSPDLLIQKSDGIFRGMCLQASRDPVVQAFLEQGGEEREGST
ncbi:MAG: P-loop containing nucleoside triphosphate hydrolase protein [Piptocephalis tieghemiana]|nr:MAG: P-loop containing nucleoside triphosphate hydrolase protein [Piptocephalis tieghemiana]